MLVLVLLKTEVVRNSLSNHCKSEQTLERLNFEILYSFKNGTACSISYRSRLNFIQGLMIVIVTGFISGLAADYCLMAMWYLNQWLRKRIPQSLSKRNPWKKRGLLHWPTRYSTHKQCWKQS